MKRLQQRQGLGHNRVPRPKPDISDLAPEKMAAVVTKKSDDLRGSLGSSLRNPVLHSKPSHQTLGSRAKPIPESGHGVVEVRSNSASIREFDEESDGNGDSVQGRKSTKVVTGVLSSEHIRRSDELASEYSSPSKAQVLAVAVQKDATH